MDAIELVEFYKTMKTKYPPFFCFRCGKKLSEEISQELEKYYSDGFVELEEMGKVPISKVCFAYFCESCLKHYKPGKIISGIKSVWIFIVEVIVFLFWVIASIVAFIIGLVLRVFKKK